MPEKLQLKVAVCQPLRVIFIERRMQPMVAITSEQARKEFSERLNALLDHHDVPERGRPAMLAKKYRITTTACQKWLNGEAIPEHSRLSQIAKDYGAAFEWLATGQGEMLRSTALTTETGQAGNSQEDDTVVVEIAHQGDRSAEDIGLLRQMVSLWAGDRGADARTVVIRRGGTLIPPGTHTEHRGGKPAEPVHSTRSRGRKLTDDDGKSQ